MPENLIRDTVYVVMQSTPAHEEGSNWLLISILVLVALAVMILFWKRLRPLFKKWSIKSINVSIPGIETELSYSEPERDLAWRLYVKLATRVSGNGLREDAGLLRESLNSLYKVYNEMRDILENSPKEVVRIPVGNKETVASLTIRLMKENMHPFLSYWHPMLMDWEAGKVDNVSVYAHEKAWPHNADMRKELSDMVKGLGIYISDLRRVAGGKA